MRALVPSALAFALAACASTGEPAESYAERERQLAEGCAARGGILSPTGAQTGKPQLDSVCRISGDPPRIVRN